MESCGRLGREGYPFLFDLGDISTSDGRVRTATFVQSVTQELVCVAAMAECTFSLRSPLPGQFIPNSCPTDEGGEVYALATNCDS